MAAFDFKTVGFIGGGRVTRLLLDGWKQARRMPSKILVSDANKEVLTQLQSDFSEIRVLSNPDCGEATLVVLAVHPPAIRSVFEEIARSVSPSAVVLSLAPKISSATIQSALGTPAVARMIPNAPSAIGLGYNPVSYSAGLRPSHRQALEDLFAPWGEAPEVPEKDLEAYAMISAMGPTYMWFQWQALRELSQEFGLSPEAADSAVLKMVEGAVKCLFCFGRRPEDVLDMIPVKPLGPYETTIVDTYKERLTALHGKLTTN